MSIGAFHLAAKESFIIRKPRSSEFQRGFKNKTLGRSSVHNGKSPSKKPSIPK
ncbi:hypothetical protein LEP1GSC186_0266 [Leptospira noguchii serovar Autumnalis str. ZUN142]|uniref:Uncharacterized protein n=1 Tax=Leptospira noguchii serovar Autumnalis str. ZUN142 TaxID=1085540 RepID=M6U3M0_9LEPT|nr:hypothetical protein LEP1GSC186_0266 [Leptospira noguchii serovar Autumnalis str. ZUN142]